MHILYDHQDLDLQTVFLLDRVQKGLSLDKADVDKLRAAKLVEGRITSLFLSASASKVWMIVQAISRIKDLMTNIIKI